MLNVKRINILISALDTPVSITDKIYFVVNKVKSSKKLKHMQLDDIFMALV